MSEHYSSAAKLVADIAAVSVTAAALMQWLPPIAAGLSIVWLSIQIVDYIFVKRIPQCIKKMLSGGK